MGLAYAFLSLCSLHPKLLSWCPERGKINICYLLILKKTNSGHACDFLSEYFQSLPFINGIKYIVSWSFPAGRCSFPFLPWGNQHGRLLCSSSDPKGAWGGNRSKLQEAPCSWRPEIVFSLPTGLTKVYLGGNCSPHLGNDVPSRLPEGLVPASSLGKS